MNGVIYEIGTGRLLSAVSGPDVSEGSVASDFGLVGGFLVDVEYAEGHYVLSGIITPRPVMPVTQAGNILTVPLGTEFSVLGPATAEGITEDGSIEFEFSEPGTYTVMLRLFPYLDAEVTLEG